MVPLLHSIPSPTKICEELEQTVLKDLHGPVRGREEELDEQSVRDRYLVGMLAPSGSNSHPLPATHHPPRTTDLDTDDIMAAFRQAACGKGWLDRDELLKEVSLVLGYQRLGPRIDEALRGHLRAAIRRRIIETDGPTLVRAGAVSMADYEPDELVEVFRSVMRKGTSYDREEVIPALARYLGFVRLTDTIRQHIKSAITRAIRHGLLEYEGSAIWRP